MENDGGWVGEECYPFPHPQGQKRIIVSLKLHAVSNPFGVLLIHGLDEFTWQYGTNQFLELLNQAKGA